MCVIEESTVNDGNAQLLGVHRDESSYYHQYPTCSCMVFRVSWLSMRPIATVFSVFSF